MLNQRLLTLVLNDHQPPDSFQCHMWPAVLLDRNEILQVRTYERGVEDETLSCGTGVTAVAIASTYAKKYNSLPVKIQTPGGNLEISFKQNGNQFTDVWLSGPAEQVFQGVIEC